MPREPQTRFERLLELLYWLLARGHTGIGLGLRWGGRAVNRFLLGRLPWRTRLAALLAALAVFVLWFAMWVHDWVLFSDTFSKENLVSLERHGLLASVQHYGTLGLGLGLLLALSVALAYVRRRFAYACLRVAGAAFAGYWAYFLYLVVRLPGALFSLNDRGFDKVQRNELWVQGFLVWLLPLAVVLVYLICLARRVVREAYCAPPPRTEPVGDRVVEDLKTHGGDPLYRTSLYWSTFAHIFVLFILPLILLRGCMAPYGPPLGEGEPVIEYVKVKQVKKKPKKLYALNMNSPIIFYRPDIDESRIMEEVEEQTLDTYVATAITDSKLGKGKKGRGGWPHGMEGGKIRFIRLEYDGGDWDQDMGVNADYNFLLQFHALTGFAIADNTEHIDVRSLKRFPKHRAPPFVFMTGRGNIQMSKDEIKTLRWYCLEEGGMIFADNGGGNFDYHFRNLMRRAFPELQWIDIANDDILYRQPFLFPSGAPPLWHHSGNRALGLKYNGRWVVFYHQGDVNDAWKTGHSGASKSTAAAAYKLGINIVNYAFNAYMDLHFKE